MNALKSGKYTAAAIQSHREIRALFREIEAQFKNSK
jgi:DNA uptake protein ComE-like DNA-binding protein